MSVPTEVEELMQTVDWLGKEKPRAPREEELEGIQSILSTLDAEEVALIRQIDTSIPIRHLRAQKGNPTKTVTSIRSTLEFRKDFFGDPVQVDSPSMREQIAPDVRTGRSYVRGYDRDGRAICINKYKPVHYQNDMSTEKYFFWNVEKVLACTRKSGLEKVITVFDYTDYTTKYEASLSIAKRFITNIQKHYPERTHKVYIVDAPTAFRALYAILKPFIDPDTKSKLIFCSSKDIRALMEDVVDDPDRLEAFMGGTNTMRDFDANEYLTIPFNQAFDEI